MSSRGCAFPEKESGRQCRATNLRERRQDWTAIAMTGEVSKRRSDELAELRWGYLTLADKMPNARVVKTDQPLEDTIDDVTEIIFNYLSRRIARRPNLA